MDYRTGDPLFVGVAYSFEFFCGLISYDKLYNITI